MTTPVTAAALPVADPATPADAPPPNLFAALLAGTLVPPPVAPLPGTPEPPTDETVVASTAPAAWTAATTTLPLAASTPAAPPTTAPPTAPTTAPVAATAVGGPVTGSSDPATPTVPAAPAAAGAATRPSHPEHPVHPVHPVHPTHPVHPLHPVHPAQAASPAEDPEAATPAAPVAAPLAVPTGSAAPTTADASPSPEVVDATGTAAVDTAAPTVVEAPQPLVADQTVVPLKVEARAQESSPTDPVRPAVAAAARRLHRDGDVQSLVVRLDPPELGAVLVRMTVRDGHVEVSLRAPDVAARGDLLAQAPEIAQVVRDAGLDLSSFDVSLSDAWTGADRSQQESTDRGTPRRSPRADGSVPVTDDALDPAAPQPAGTWL